MANTIKHIVQTEIINEDGDTRTLYQQNTGYDVLVDGKLNNKKSDGSSAVPSDIHNVQQLVNRLGPAAFMAEEELGDIGSGGSGGGGSTAVAGFYNTLTDLRNDEKANKKKIYVVLEDKQWYFFSADKYDWTAGGAYLSDGHTHPNLEILNSITKADIERWNSGTGGGKTISFSASFSKKEYAAQEEIVVSIMFTSPNVGDGDLHVIINAVEQTPITIKQGSSTVRLPGMAKGSYEVSLYVVDKKNTFSNSVSSSLTVGSLDISSQFNDQNTFTVGQQIRIPYTIETVTSEPITLHIQIDSSEYEKATNSGYNYYTLPGQSAGAHKVTMYATAGPYTSGKLTFTIIVEASDTLIIISDFDKKEFEYREIVDFDYRVSLKGETKFNAIYYIDNEEYKTLTINTGANLWSIRTLEIGTHTLKIVVSSRDGLKTAQIERSFKIVASSYKPLSPITDASLLCYFDATGRSNQDNDRDTWTDKSGNGVKATLKNFVYTSSNGWVNDALVCNGGSYVEIDLQPLLDNAPYGLTFDIKFSATNNGDEETCVMDCRGSDNYRRGFSISPLYAFMNSGSKSIKTPILEGDISRITYVIDRDNKLAIIYNNGVMSEPFIMTDSETFVNNTKIYLNAALSNVNGVLSPTKFGSCKIYTLRIYDRALTYQEIVQNKIADIPNLTEQEEVYNMNYKNAMPTMYFYGDTSAMTKANKVKLRVKYISTDMDKYGASFDLPQCLVSWQGTSSLQYAVKNYKIKLVAEDGSKYKYTPFPNGILESTYTLKADYMDSSHANNTGMAKFINDCLYDEQIPPQRLNDNVRTTINGFPIQLYIAQSDTSTPEYIGVFNFDLDKGCTASFGLDNTIEGFEKCVSFEVAANSDTSAGAFRTDDMTSIKEDFELRYPDEDDVTDAQKENYFKCLQRLVSWVYNCPDAKTFKNEFDQYLNKEYTLKYYLNVHVFGMVDNLGKNMMLTSWDGSIWYPEFYDLDTILGLDNTGYLEFASDIDVTKDVYNTSNSKLWKLVVEAFSDELAKMYITMRAKEYSLDNILRYWYEEQVAKIGELQFNADAYAKYIQFKNDYLFMLHGRRYEHMKQWMTERLLYLDSIYGYEEDIKQSITIRANKAGIHTLAITTYSPQYVRVKWKNNMIEKLKVGRENGIMVPTTFTGTITTDTDQEILIYNAKHIKVIDNLAGLNPSVINITEASKLVKLECKNSLLLSDVRISSNNKWLKTLDLSGCTILGTSSSSGSTFDLSDGISLEEVNLTDTKIENVNFPVGGNLKSIKLPNTVRALDLENMPMLTSLGIGNNTSSIYRSNIVYSRLRIVDCPQLNVSLLYNVRAESIHLENSFKDKPSGIFNLNYPNSTLDGQSNTIESLTLRDLSCFDNANLVIYAGDFHETTPGTNSFSIINVPCDTLDIRKIGFTSLMDLDLSVSKARALKIFGYANIDNLIIPKTIKGLYIGANAYITASDSSMSKFGSNIVIMNNIRVDGVEDQDNLIDLSSIQITRYLNTNYTKKTLKINCDFSKSDLSSNTITGTHPSFNCYNIQDNFIGYCFASKFQTRLFENRKYMTSDQLKMMLDRNNEDTYMTYDISEIVDYSYMFNGCRNLTIVDFLNTSMVTSFAYAFQGCTNLTTVKNLDTSKSESFYGMFKDCSNLITVSGIDTSNGFSFDRMFQNCISLTSPPNLNTTNGYSFSYMFAGCTLLSTVSDIDVSNATSLESFFDGCYKLAAISKLNTSKVTSFFRTFADCKALTMIPELDFSNAYTMEYAFYGCESLTSLPELNTKKCTTFAATFQGCKNLITITDINTANCNSFYYTFYGCEKLVSLPEIDTSKASSFQYMFAECKSLISIPQLTTSSGTSFESMFNNCENITVINDLDTSKADMFDNMFNGCKLLQHIPKINTSRGTSFNGTFSKCESISTIPEFDFSNGRYFANIFSGCINLQTLPELDTSNATNMSYAFYRCNNLKSIASVDFTSINMFDYIFMGCDNLSSITFAGTFRYNNMYNADFLNSSSYALKGLSALDEASVTSLINALEDRSMEEDPGLITFHKDVYTTLKSEQFTALNAKNWTVASA